MLRLCIADFSDHNLSCKMAFSSRSDSAEQRICFPAAQSLSLELAICNQFMYPSKLKTINHLCKMIDFGFIPFSVYSYEMHAQSLLSDRLSHFEPHVAFSYYCHAPDVENAGSRFGVVYFCYMYKI